MHDSFQKEPSSSHLILESWDTTNLKTWQFKRFTALIFYWQFYWLWIQSCQREKIYCCFIQLHPSLTHLQVDNKIKEEGFRFQTFVPRYVLPLIHIMMISISITIISPLSPDTLTKPRSILSLDWKRPLLSQRTAGSFLFLLRVQTSINAGTECDFVTGGRRNSKVKTRFIGNLSENIYLLEVTHHCGFKERWCQPLWLLLKSVWLWLNWG